MSGSALHRLVRLLRPLLTPAAPSRRLSTPVAHLSPEAGRQVSQGNARDLRAIYLSHLRPHPPGDIGLRALWLPRPDADALYALPVRQAGTLLTAFLQTPPRDDALAVRLTVPITRARRGLPPPSHRPDTIPIKRCFRTTRGQEAGHVDERQDRLKPPEAQIQAATPFRRSSIMEAEAAKFIGAGLVTVIFDITIVAHRPVGDGA